MFLKLSSNIVGKLSPNIAIYRLVGTELYITDNQNFMFCLWDKEIVVVIIDWKCRHVIFCFVEMLTSLERVTKRLYTVDQSKVMKPRRLLTLLKETFDIIFEVISGSIIYVP